jgi:hypothetical protein
MPDVGSNQPADVRLWVSLDVQRSPGPQLNHHRDECNSKSTNRP